MIKQTIYLLWAKSCCRATWSRRYISIGRWHFNGTRNNRVVGIGQFGTGQRDKQYGMGHQWEGGSGSLLGSCSKGKCHTGVKHKWSDGVVTSLPFKKARSSVGADHDSGLTSPLIYPPPMDATLSSTNYQPSKDQSQPLPMRCATPMEVLPPPALHDGRSCEIPWPLGPNSLSSEGTE